MDQDDDETLGGFSDLLADIGNNNNSEQGDNVVTFHKTQLSDDKLLVSVFGDNGDNSAKKIQITINHW